MFDTAEFQNSSLTSSYFAHCYSSVTYSTSLGHVICVWQVIQAKIKLINLELENILLPASPGTVPSAQTTVARYSTALGIAL